MIFLSSALFALVLNCSSPLFRVSEHLPAHAAPAARAGHCQPCWHGHQSSVPLSEGFWLPINLSSRPSPLSIALIWQSCCRTACSSSQGCTPPSHPFPGLPVCAQAGFPPTSALLFTEAIAVSCCFRWSCRSSLDSCPPCWHPVAFEPHQLKSLMVFAPCCYNCESVLHSSQCTWFIKEFLAFLRVFIYIFSPCEVLQGLLRPEIVPIR